MPLAEYIIGIDYGEKRVGVALAHNIARLPKPYATLSNSETLSEQIASIVKNENVGQIVVGLPMSMDGSESTQTKIVAEFASKLKKELDIPIFLVDESLTSVAAEEILSGQKHFNKSDIDALAAAIILERYFDDVASAELVP